MEKTYRCTYASEYAETFSLDEIYKLIRNGDLLTLRLKNGLEIYQRQDIDAKVETRNGWVQMHFGDVYLSDTQNIVDKYNERKEDIEEWIEKCENIDVDGLSELLKKQ